MRHREEMSVLLLVGAVLLLLCAPVRATGQDFATGQGTWVLAGSASFSSEGGELNETGDGDRRTTLTLAPQALYFVTDGLALGGVLMYEHTTPSDVTSIGVGPQVAYFFGDQESVVYPFVGVQGMYVSVTSDPGDATGLGFGGGAGAVFMITRSVGIMTMGSYNVLEVDFDGFKESGNEFLLEVGVAAFVF